MSSENVSSAMAQKTVMFDLDGSLLVIEGVDPEVFSIDCSSPKLSLKQLYDAVFADIQQPTTMTVQASTQVDSNPKARSFFTSVKKVIDEAAKEINAKLPSVIAQREMMEKSLKESMAGQEEE